MQRSYCIRTDSYQYFRVTNEDCVVLLIQIIAQIKHSLINSYVVYTVCGPNTS